jgi:TatD DNase family protein
MLKVIDSHCHLDQLDDPEQALLNAVAAGVEAVVCVGTSLESNLKNLELMQKPSRLKLILGLGIHPTEIESEKIEEGMDFIRQNIRSAACIGEIGLDFWRKEIKKNPQKKAEQEEVFIRQLALAREFALPVSIHSRGSWQRCLEILKGSGVKKAVFHWYSGPLDVLQEIITQGFYISATPALMYSQQHQAAIKSAPLEKIFLETDSPVFYGEEAGGFRAEPKDVVKTLELVAKLKEVSPEVVAQTTTSGAGKFFGGE